jgi:hypothetical protein
LEGEDWRNESFVLLHERDFQWKKSLERDYFPREKDYFPRDERPDLLKRGELERIWFLCY